LYFDSIPVICDPSSLLVILRRNLRVSNHFAFQH
jgi:hypothetical protein